MITIVGIGENAGCITKAGAKKARAADRLFVRSFKTRAGRGYKNKAQSMDEIFDTAKNFEDAAKAIADALLSAAADGGEVVYLTDGTGISDGVFELLSKVKADVAIIPAPLTLSQPSSSWLTVTADTALEELPYIDTAAGLLIINLDSQITASEIKLKLFDFYPPEQEAVFTGADAKAQSITVEDIDRQKKYGESASVFIAGDYRPDKAVACFGDVKRMMERLTAPDGCPWDIAQTHESIRINMIEEAYEAVDALDSESAEEITEELGDVFLQSLFHADIARRTGEFTLSDVFSVLQNKLYSRHTHIFGEKKASDGAEALKHWDKAKAEEKSYVSLYDELHRMPEGFPSLLRLQKAYKKAAKAGKEQPVGQLYDTAKNRADAFLSNKTDKASATEQTKTELVLLLRDLTRIGAALGVDVEAELNKAAAEYIGTFKE